MAEKNDILVQVDHLKKYFPVKQTKLLEKKSYVHAVDDVSFVIKRGEILGLVGESGSGKTTVGKTVLNLLNPTGGSAVFEGQTLFDVENGKVKNVQFVGGCNGNLKGIAALVEGMDVAEVITRVEGIRCGMKATSCPDQLAQALKEVNA